NFACVNGYITQPPSDHPARINPGAYGPPQLVPQLLLEFRKPRQFLTRFSRTEEPDHKGVLCSRRLLWCRFLLFRLRSAPQTLCWQSRPPKRRCRQRLRAFAGLRACPAETARAISGCGSVTGRKPEKLRHFFCLDPD